ncbi:MAG: alpha-2-macroglobulin family protein [Dehalococcoidia bacterium]|nr:alpha-2-macroglobulin family protein [Dehalococcoidia bacterium]
MKRNLAVIATLILVLLAPTVLGCGSAAKPKVASVSVASYIAIAPKTLHIGENAAVTFTLLGEQGQLTRDTVSVDLLSDGKSVASAKEQVIGKGQIEINVPSSLLEGDYQLRVKGSDFDEQASIQVKRSLLVFLETDKPIYKPAQTLHIRAITLNSDLRPLSETIIVDVLDAKGIKIFRKEVKTDDYGMATLDLPISDEPNLGTWKINAAVGESKTQLDVRVEEYVLPKYEVTVDLPKEWYLIDEPIKGTISAEYSFGKPVKGELEIVASRYVGKWEEYATVTKEIDGQTQFEIPAVQYVAGVPEARGMGNVTLDVTVREQSTGYQEKTTRMFTIAQSPLTVQIIPESIVFKPTLPFNFLIVTETPDNQLTDALVQVTVTYVDKDFDQFKKDTTPVKTQGGKAILSFTPPEKATALQIEALELTPISSRQPAQATRTVEAGYSPTGNFIHLEQVSQGIPQVGQNVVFKVYSTREATNFYYEVVSRDKVVFSAYTQDNEISVMATPQMAPSARLLVYQILPNSEVAADYLPFSIDARYPNAVTVDFSTDEAKPGDEITIDVQSDGQSKVGIVAVDKSVFILAENRLNLQQVFDELERLYMQPQVELHEVNIYSDIATRGASETFSDAGVIVLSNQKVPEGKEYQSPVRAWADGGVMIKGQGFANAEEMVVPSAAPSPTETASESLAEVQRVRQFFPETWLWQDVTTDSKGKASVNATVPDSITTWVLRAVALSKEKGLGIGEAQLKAFQPFFLSIDLPYSSIRGEEFPVKVAIYNYLNETQKVVVKIDQSDWFDLLDEASQSVEIAPNEVGGVEFMIRPRALGINQIKITAQSTQAADAAIKTVIVEPEGVAREEVQNITLSAGTSQTLDTSIPALVVEDSGRAYLAVTASFLTQTIDGLDQLLQMPYGCGEQNMIVFAPDVFITKYLQESGQIKPEIMAKAEKLMITGYQRELTYRHRDGSFSAFGEQDESGSLWLTAFVLKSFAQAKGLIYIDDAILSEAQQWITSHQKADGSFESVGFLHHQELLGGLQGKDALTAYVAIALMENSEKSASGKAVRYLEGRLDEMDDAYTLALTAYALELAGSGLKNTAHDKLMDMAQADENGLHWGNEVEIVPMEKQGVARPWMPPQNQSAVVETTAYATLALTKHGDAFNTSRAAKWLVSQRNAYGGYGSTQDTVVALQALTEQASGARADVDLRVIVTGAGPDKEIKITPENFDVLQIIDVPVDKEIQVLTAGKGEAIAQLVKRFNLPEVDQVTEPVMKVNVSYDATEVEVNDKVKVSATVEFNPPKEMGLEMEAGMVVVDISVPTGFAPVTDTVAAVVENNKKFKRYDVAGRKVIFYIENMKAGEKISFSFDVQAMYPVKAKGVASTAYSYYQPELKGESLSQAIVVN